jgi:hypothetical protein
MQFTLVGMAVAAVCVEPGWRPTRRSRSSPAAWGIERAGAGLLAPACSRRSIDDPYRTTPSTRMRACLPCPQGESRRSSGGSRSACPVNCCLSEVAPCQRRCQWRRQHGVCPVSGRRAIVAAMTSTSHVPTSGDARTTLQEGISPCRHGGDITVRRA